MEDFVTVIGGGLAGCEASWQLARRGIQVQLYEMRPNRMTPAHTTDHLSELVCSNSLRSNAITNAVGLLKEELRVLESLIIEIADETRVPAGLALAVDREEFANRITNKVYNNKNIKVIREEVIEIPGDRIVIIATGPLTSQALSIEIKNFTGESYLYFYDAIAPIVEYDSIDMSKIFKASRYDKGGTKDYLNCALTEEEYYSFVKELNSGEKYPLKDFEKGVFFDGCMPIEQMAERGKDTLLFGPMKPVGLADPETGKIPFAVVQLRQDNKIGSLYNIVGFQTRLIWKEQDRIFRMIPGLKNAEFVRFGSMHRNTFINSPKLLNEMSQLKSNPKIFFAGQMTGVEGYVESTSSGLITGINAANYIQGKHTESPPSNTACGALLSYISSSKLDFFQPMNINYGIIYTNDDIKRIRNKEQRYQLIAGEAISSLKKWKEIYF